MSSPSGSPPAGTGELLADLRELVVETWRETQGDIDLTLIRHRVVKGNPELAGQRMATMARVRG